MSATVHVRVARQRGGEPQAGKRDHVERFGRVAAVRAGGSGGSMTLDQCQKVHGQPCVRIKGIGLGPVPGLRMKCTGTCGCQKLGRGC